METTLDGLQFFSRIECHNKSYNQPSPPQFLDMYQLLNQRVLHDTIVYIGKGEEPLHVIVIISPSNKLITTFENVDSRLEPNDPTKFLNKDMIVHPLGCN